MTLLAILGLWMIISIIACGIWALIRWDHDDIDDPSEWGDWE